MVHGEPWEMHLMTRCAVVGSPIDHSLSPAIHQAAYGWLGLDWRYERHRVVAADLAGFVAGLDTSWRGLSCTMPLKQAAVALGVADPVVQTLAVANTLVFDGVPADMHTTRVYNTDVSGLVSAVRLSGVNGVTRAVLLGNGATARSALLAVSQLGASQATVLARDPAKSAALAELGQGFGVEVHHLDLGSVPGPADLVVSTLPAAAAAAVAAALTAELVVDVVYDPWPTPLAQEAIRRGLRLLSGLDLLAHQAVGQVEAMTGRTVPVEVLLEAAQSELSRRRLGRAGAVSP